MNEGNITVVDVIATDDGYQLSRPAQDLYIAYEVVRRHIDSDGVRHYAQLVSEKVTEDGYEFVFDTGDVFTASSADARPAASVMSDVQTVKPLTFYATDTDGSQLKRGSATGDSTTEDDWNAITAAIEAGRSVVVMVTGLPHLVTGAASAEVTDGTACKIAIVGFGTSQKGVQTRVVCTLASDS